jgi:LuxR family maltose regulon positive regulatory protein
VYLSTDDSPRIKQDAQDALSEREIEILRLLADGLTNQEIAEKLILVVGTVKAHNNHIFSKLSVSNRTQAIARARQLGLI